MRFPVNQSLRWCAALWFVGLAVAVPAGAQSEDPLRFIRWPVGDVLAAPRSMFTLRTGLTIGVATGGILAASHFDRRFSRRAERLDDLTPTRMRKVFHEIGNVSIVRPMAAVVFVGALTSSNIHFQDAAFTSLESVIFANLLANGLKLAIGRARPNENAGPNSVKPFSGSRSFPSGHATTVFAFTTPWIFYYPGLASGALFALGLGTAVVRMADEYHWFSDVLGGAFLGFGVGYLLSRRHQRLSRAPSLSLSANGVSLTWRL